MSNKTVDYIRKHISPFQPQTLIILGSGLGNLGEKLQEPISLSYRSFVHARSFSSLRRP